jgi:hypothetical protein
MVQRARVEPARAVFLVVGVMLSALGCKSETQQQADQQAILRQAEEHLKEEKALEEARLKRQILANPNAYLQVSGLNAFDKGILDSYRQLTTMTVMNKTTYPLTAFTGEVHWLSDQNEVREVTIFRLRGSLAPGDTKTFKTADGSLDTGTTESHAHKYEVSFKQVKFVDVAE